MNTISDRIAKAIAIVVLAGMAVLAFAGAAHAAPTGLHHSEHAVVVTGHAA